MMNSRNITVLSAFFKKKPSTGHLPRQYIISGR
jgi:hypothetical protein